MVIYNIKIYSRVLIGTLLVLFFFSCVTNETLYLNRTYLSSGKSFVYYADKYDCLCIQKRFQDGRQFCNGLAAVKFEGKWGYINSLGNTIIPFQYDWVSSFGEFGFNDNVAVVKNNIDNDKIPMFTACPSWLINKRGEKITPRYGIILPIENKLSIVNSGEKFQSVGKSFAISDGKWGCINERGEEVVKCQYDLIYPFREKITFVQKSGKWGMINENGREVIPCIYDGVCYKSKHQTIDTQFDMAPVTVLKKRMIPNQQNGIIYMLKQNRIYSFLSNGSFLNKKKFHH